MSELFKTATLTYNELLFAYEQIGTEYQKETQENAELKSSLKQVRAENERLQKRVNELKKQINHYDKNSKCN